MNGTNGMCECRECSLACITRRNNGWMNARVASAVHAAHRPILRRSGRGSACHAALTPDAFMLVPAGVYVAAVPSGSRLMRESFRRPQWTRHFFYRTEHVKTTWTFRLGLAVLFFGGAWLTSGWWTVAVARS